MTSSKTTAAAASLAAPQALSIANFAIAFGCALEEIPDFLLERITGSDFSYRRLNSSERDKTIVGILKRLDANELSKVGEHRKEVWEKGWEENLDAFASQGFALETLVPRFIRPEPIIRLNQDYALAINPKFELHFHEIVRCWLFLRYLANASAVYEFGCGSAYNLVAMAELSTDMRFVGLDWADSAVKLANMIGEARGINLTGRRFDFFHPDDTIPLGTDDAVLTICAMEQIGTHYEAFLQFLLCKRPRICVHMEPLIELYCSDNLVDYLAIRYHTSRGYLSGFLRRLKQLQADRRLEIVKVQRLNFGSLYHEGYSVVAWRPI